VLLSAAVSGCKLSALVATAAVVVMTTRSARLLPKTKLDCAEFDSVEVVVTVVMLVTGCNHR